jgi:hypothetical protein
MGIPPSEQTYMPIISIFFGMVIRIYHSDHNPPHFHVQYGEDEAQMEIESGKLMAGKFPLRLLKIVQEWRKQSVTELKKAWADAQALRMPKRIKPLE